MLDLSDRFSRSQDPVLDDVPFVESDSYSSFNGEPLPHGSLQAKLP
jgi:hypothetical protein